MEILSATASIIAIIGVAWGWYKSAQKPLTMDRVVIHKKKEESTYILIVKNRKSYPVEIKSINCYTKHTYKVDQKNNQKPEYSAVLSLSDSPFLCNESFEIGANGHDNLHITGEVIDGEVNKLLFSMQTSHGYHELWCKDIIVVNMDGNTEAYGLEHKYDTDSILKAKAKYYWLKALSLFK